MLLWPSLLYFLVAFIDLERLFIAEIEGLAAKDASTSSEMIPTPVWVDRSVARMGVQASPDLLRGRAAKIWSCGWSYLGATATEWATAAGTDGSAFVSETCKSRWGTAADAVAGATPSDTTWSWPRIRWMTLPIRLCHATFFVSQVLAIDLWQFCAASGPAEVFEVCRNISLCSTPAPCPAAKSDQDPNGCGGEEEKKPSGSGGSEARSREDLEGHKSEGPILEGLSFVQELFLWPGKSRLGRLQAAIAHAGGGHLGDRTIDFAYAGGMPTKHLPRTVGTWGAN
eukprot:6490465-Amphidinium_carterae.2